MRTVAIVAITLSLGLAQSGPVVLSGDDIGDNYDEQPEGLRSVDGWLGLFTTENRPADRRGESRVAVARVRFVKSGEVNGDLKMETTPPNAILLVSGVRGIVPGPAITAAQFLDLGHDEREASVRLGQRLYTIRLLASEPDHCDAVVALTSGADTQRLFDIKNPPLPFACDDPHFRIHWAGDLDRDGRLDLLVTFSEKYSYHPRQLFLSSAAKGRNLVAEVARYDRLAQ